MHAKRTRVRKKVQMEEIQENINKVSLPAPSIPPSRMSRTPFVLLHLGKHEAHEHVYPLPIVCFLAQLEAANRVLASRLSTLVSKSFTVNVEEDKSSSPSAALALQATRRPCPVQSDPPQLVQAMQQVQESRDTPSQPLSDTSSHSSLDGSSWQ